MTGPEPVPARPLPQSLLEQPWDYRFFQAVRLLELLQPRRATVGGSADAASEAVRFSAHQTLGYPASEIQSLEAAGEAQPRMAVNFMGLSGALGELPVAYTAHVIERMRQRDATTAEFFDIFNHRLISLFYRAWEKYRFTVPYERGEPGGLTQYMLDLLGLGAQALQNRQAVNDQSLVYYAGLLTQKPRSAQALEQLLNDYFDAPVEIIQFVGAWRGLDEQSLCVLDDDPARATASSQLGLGAVAGDEVWDPQSIVRIRLGPLPLDRYLEFLPNGSAYPALGAILKFYAGHSLDFEVQLVLKREEAPGVELGAEGPEGPQLGWVSWVKSVPMGRDPDDTVYCLSEEEASSHGR